jgi:hypothetical protein
MHLAPSTPIVPRGFPRGVGRVGPWVWTGAWCMGAVRRQANRPASQLPPGLLLDAGRAAANTANSMMNEGARVQHTSMDITRSAALLIQHYGTTG